MKLIKHPSPNFSSSKFEKIGVMLHKTLGKDSLKELTTAGTNKSAHYLITRRGVIYQLVDLDKRAWTAGRISKPSMRAKNIMFRNILGLYVKPGHYLIQVEFECLASQTFTRDQYTAFNQLQKTFNFKLESWNLLTHHDTAIDKPLLEFERDAILEKMNPMTITTTTSFNLDEFSFKNGDTLRVKVDKGKVTLTKK